jgi:hypothetical protein
MNKKLSKAELLSSAKVLAAVEFETQLSPKTEPKAQTEVRQDYGQTGSLDLIAIARAEMARRRRRLGTLTRGQEVAIENLLLSTVTRISELMGRALELPPHSESSCTLLQEPSSHSSN